MSRSLWSGRDVSIVPWRDLADGDKLCKSFVGDDARIVPDGPCRIFHYLLGSACGTTPQSPVVTAPLKGGSQSLSFRLRWLPFEGSWTRSGLRVAPRHKPKNIHAGAAERCLSRQAGIVRCCPIIKLAANPALNKSLPPSNVPGGAPFRHPPPSPPRG